MRYQHSPDGGKRPPRLVWLTSVSEGHQHWNVADVPGSYDVITTFDVIHDAVDPAGILRAIRPAGRCVCVDINCLERPTDNTGQIATCSVPKLSCGPGGLGFSAVQAIRRYSLITPLRTRCRRIGSLSSTTVAASWLGGRWSRP